MQGDSLLSLAVGKELLEYLVIASLGYVTYRLANKGVYEPGSAWDAPEATAVASGSRMGLGTGSGYPPSRQGSRFARQRSSHDGTGSNTAYSATEDANSFHTGDPRQTSRNDAELDAMLLSGSHRPQQIQSFTPLAGGAEAAGAESCTETLATNILAAASVEHGALQPSSAFSALNTSEHNLMHELEYGTGAGGIPAPVIGRGGRSAIGSIELVRVGRGGPGSTTSWRAAQHSTVHEAPEEGSVPNTGTLPSIEFGLGSSIPSSDLMLGSELSHGYVQNRQRRSRMIMEEVAPLDDWLEQGQEHYSGPAQQTTSAGQQHVVASRAIRKSHSSDMRGPTDGPPTLEQASKDALEQTNKELHGSSTSSFTGDAGPNGGHHNSPRAGGKGGAKGILKAVLKAMGSRRPSADGGEGAEDQSLSEDEGNEQLERRHKLSFTTTTARVQTNLRLLPRAGAGPGTGSSANTSTNNTGVYVLDSPAGQQRRASTVVQSSGNSLSLSQLQHPALQMLEAGPGHGGLLGAEPEEGEGEGLALSVSPSGASQLQPHILLGAGVSRMFITSTSRQRSVGFAGPHSTGLSVLGPGRGLAEEGGGQGLQYLQEKLAPLQSPPAPTKGSDLDQLLLSEPTIDGVIPVAPGLQGSPARKASASFEAVAQGKKSATQEAVPHTESEAATGGPSSIQAPAVEGQAVAEMDLLQTATSLAHEEPLGKVPPQAAPCATMGRVAIWAHRLGLSFFIKRLQGLRRQPSAAQLLLAYLSGEHTSEKLEDLLYGNPQDVDQRLSSVGLIISICFLKVAFMHSYSWLLNCHLKHARDNT